MGYQIVTPFAVNKKNGDNNGYIKKDVIKMTVPKLENKENANSEIKHIETAHKPYKALHNRHMRNRIDTSGSGFNSRTERYGDNERDCCGYAVGYGIDGGIQ